MIYNKLIVLTLTVLFMFGINQYVNCQHYFDFEDPFETFASLGIQGDTTLFILGNGQLQLNASGAASPATLLLPSDVVTNAVWEFHLEFDFNPSSSNYLEVFLMSNLDSAGEISEGYYIKVGGSDDDIKLYRKEQGNKTLIIDGQDKLLDLPNSKIDIKITRDSLGTWDLFSKTNPASPYYFEGTTIDDEINTSAFFHLSCHFTTTRADKFRFDNINIEGVPYPDIFAPNIETLQIIGPDILRLAFDEVVNLEPESFHILYPQPMEVDSMWLAEGNVYGLRFDNSFINGYTHRLSVSDVTDQSLNVLEADTLEFLYYVHTLPQHRDVIVNEIFADPNPAEDLPDGEFIEIWNRSSNPQNLEGWKLADNRSEAFLDKYFILPDSFLILTSSSNAFKFLDHGSVLSISNWPSLNNDSEKVILSDSSGKIIDSVYYESSYHKLEKSKGGWTLERINPDNPCNTSSNWASSLHPSGGTPGRINSVFDNSPDTIPPMITSVLPINTKQIEVLFSESVVTGIEAPFLNAKQVSWLAVSQDLKQWVISSEESLLSNQDYTLRLQQVQDCFENNLNPYTYSFSFDFDPPELDSAYFIYHDQIDLVFNEDIDPTSLEIEFIGNEIENNILHDTQDGRHLSVLIDSMLLKPTTLTMSLYNLADVKGNFMDELEITIYYQPPGIPGKNDLIITEIMADPVPSAGLPEAEFIEIFNNTSQTFPLRGLQIKDPLKTGVIDDGFIEPGEYVILCPQSALPLYDSHGTTSGVTNWPYMNSSRDTLTLVNQDNLEIFSLSYSNDWYVDEEKRDGGWSLELTDNNSTCLGELVWEESKSDSGGTPGKSNSHPDYIQQAAVLLSWEYTNGDTLLLEFDRKMNMPEGQSLRMLLDSTLVIPQVFPSNNSEYHLGIIPPTPFLSDSVQHIFISGLMDCAGYESSIEIEYYSDSSLPEILAYNLVFHNQIELLFNEEVVIDKDNITINDLLPDLEIIFPDPERRDTLSIFTPHFETLSTINLKLMEVKDMFGNQADLRINFPYHSPYVAGRYDLLITEIMANPLENGVIDFEYVEIYNPTDYRIPLKDYSLQDLNTEGFIDYEFIDPDTYVVLVPDDYYGDSITMATAYNFVKLKPWPHLNKSGDRITLKNLYKEVVNQVEYNDSWYQSIYKKEGGWSLEMIDIANPCGENTNWTACENQNGGTPGSVNSVNNSKPDLRGPNVVSLYFSTQDSIILVFDERIDPKSLEISSFNLNPSVQIEHFQLQEDEKTIKIKLEHSIIPSQEYDLDLSGIMDCNGNIISDGQNRLSLIFPESPQPNDIIINEILFNPRPNGVDFVELFNTSNKYLDLNRSLITNGTDSLYIENTSPIKPFEYLVFTKDPEIIASDYPKSDLSKIVSQKIPSMPDREGWLKIVSHELTEIDELHYFENMHFELYNEYEGVSLERISIDEPSNNKNNWTSASLLSGGATPGLRNSQYREISFTENPVSVTPKIFDPHSADVPFVTIQYSFDQPGYVGTLQIYDLEGRIVKRLLDNDYLPQTGFVTWEGTYEYGEKAKTGAYIVYLRVFNLEGRIMTFKSRVVVANRF